MPQGRLSPLLPFFPSSPVSRQQVSIDHADHEGGHVVNLVHDRRFENYLTGTTYSRSTANESECKDRIRDEHVKVRQNMAGSEKCPSIIRFGTRAYSKRKSMTNFNSFVVCLYRQISSMVLKYRRSDGKRASLKEYQAQLKGIQTWNNA